MLSKMTRRLRDRTVVTAAMLSLMGCDVYAMDANALGGSNKNNDRTETPIKHVIVILGENRTFDHVFATYEPQRPGERVDNLLSKGIVTKDGLPGPNYARSAQFSAVVNNTYSINPGQKTPYNHTTNKVQAPGTSYAPQSCYTSVDQAALNGPGCLATLQLAAQGDYGLRQQDLPLLTTGATGLPGNSPDSRILDFDNLPNGPYPLVTLAQAGETPTSLYKTYGGSPVHRFYQMWQQLDCDVTKATDHNPSGCQADLFTFVEESVSSGSNGNPTPHALKEGAIALGFYNVAKGDAPYLTELARKYTLNDNFHQSVMGGTFANHMMLPTRSIMPTTRAIPRRPTTCWSPVPIRRNMSTRSRIRTRRLAPTTGISTTATAAAAIRTVPIRASRASARSSTISTPSRCRRAARRTPTIS